MKPWPKAPSRSGAFTLLELLIAVVITLVIAGLMLAVTTNVLSLWRRQQAASTQALTAKLVLDRLEQDLQAAVHRSDGRRWLAADILDTLPALANHGWLAGPGRMKPADGGSLVPLPGPDGTGVPALVSARFGLSGTWLRFVSATSETVSEPTVPRLIAYQVVRRPVIGLPLSTNPAAVRYGLYRSAIDEDDTFEAGYDVTATNYASPNNNPYAHDASLSRAPRNVMNPGHAALLADNVVDFGCWLYGRDTAGGLRRIYPGFAGDLSHQAIGQGGADDVRYPEVVDVLIRILSEEGATMVAAMEGGRLARPSEYATDAAWWWGVVDAHSSVFTRRIEIKGVAP